MDSPLSDLSPSCYLSILSLLTTQRLFIGSLSQYIKPKCALISDGRNPWPSHSSLPLSPFCWILGVTLGPKHSNPVSSQASPPPALHSTWVFCLDLYLKHWSSGLFSSRGFYGPPRHLVPASHFSQPPFPFSACSPFLLCLHLLLSASSGNKKTRPAARGLLPYWNPQKVT